MRPPAVSTNHRHLDAAWEHGYATCYKTSTLLFKQHAATPAPCCFNSTSYAHNGMILKGLGTS